MKTKKHYPTHGDRPTALTVARIRGVELATLPNDADVRVMDLELGRWLEFARPDDVRKLIERNAKELNDYGVIATVAQTSTALGGRPTCAYYLTEDQALLLCMFSRTTKAAQVRKTLIEAFKAYRLSRDKHSIWAAMLLEEPAEYGALWDHELVTDIARLDGYEHANGERFPAYLRSTFGKIYDLVVGEQVMARLRELMPKPGNGDPLRYQMFREEVDKMVRAELAGIRMAACNAVSKEDFWRALGVRYQKRPLQLSFQPTKRLLGRSRAPGAAQ